MESDLTPNAPQNLLTLISRLTINIDPLSIMSVWWHTHAGQNNQKVT